MKKQSNEIGGEFWEAPVADRLTHVFPDVAQWFLSGRSALRAIVAELKERHTVVMPSWCCDSMVKPFADAGFEIQFYSVYWQDGRLVQEVSLDSDVLLVMDYFGYTTAPPALSEYGGVVIRDVTHSLFSATYADADFFFGSLRKWCGVWTGGFAWARDGHQLKIALGDDLGYTALRREGMALKGRYIRGEEAADKGYLRLFDAAEEALKTAGIVPAAERDVELALQVDAEAIAARRRGNARVLREAFPDQLMFREMEATDCPLFVPILVPGGKRDELRRFLIQNEIYCPVHWPISRYHRLDEATERIYRDELSLVCDQRYSEADMSRMVIVMNDFWKEA